MTFVELWYLIHSEVVVDRVSEVDFRAVVSSCVHTLSEGLCVKEADTFDWQLDRCGREKHC